MINAPVAAPLLFVLLILLGVLIFVLEIRSLSYAYRRIGIAPRYVTAVLVLTFLRSYVNIPLYAVPVVRLLPPQIIERFGRAYIVRPAVEIGMTVVAVNVGGALIPLLVSIYLLAKTPHRLRMLLAVGVVAMVVHALAEIVPGIGIAVPMLIPPLTAAGVALLLAFGHAPAVAYVAGSLGALIGADIWNLRRIHEVGGAHRRDRRCWNLRRSVPQWHPRRAPGCVDRSGTPRLPSR